VCVCSSVTLYKHKMHTKKDGDRSNINGNIYLTVLY